MLEPVERSNVLSAYYKRLTGSDTSIQQRAVRRCPCLDIQMQIQSPFPGLKTRSQDTCNLIHLACLTRYEAVTSRRYQKLNTSCLIIEDCDLVFKYSAG